MAGETAGEKGQPVARGSFALSVADLSTYLAPGGFVATTTLIALAYEAGHNLAWILDLFTKQGQLPRTDVLLGAVVAFFGVSYLLGHLCAVLAVVVCERIFVCNVRGYPYRSLLGVHDPQARAPDEAYRRRYYRTMFALFFIWLFLVLREHLEGKPISGVCFPPWSAPCSGFWVLVGSIAFWTMLFLLAVALIWGLLKICSERWEWMRTACETPIVATLGDILIFIPRWLCRGVSGFFYLFEILFLDKFLGLREPLSTVERERVLEGLKAKAGRWASDLQPSTSYFWVPYLTVLSEGSSTARFLERQNLNGVLIRNMVPALIIGAFQLVPLAKEVRRLVAENCKKAGAFPCPHVDSIFDILSIGELPILVFALGIICIVRYYHLMYERFTRPLLRYFAQMELAPPQ